VCQCCSARIVVGASISTDGKRRADGDLGLAEADVAAHQAIHRTRRLQVFLHRLDRSLLVRRLPEGKLRFQPLEIFVAQVVRDAGRLLPLRIKREQLAGELADRFPRACLEIVPGLATELRERGRGVVGADVAGHLAELLVRNIEPVVAAEAEEEIVARDARDLLRLEPEQFPDTVVFVDDEIPTAQIRERLQGAPADTTLARRPFAEDLRVGQQDETEVSPDESTPRGRDGEHKPGLPRQCVSFCHDPRFDPAQEVLLPQRLPEMWESDDDTLS
jgi:hypothetical protein